MYARFFPSGSQAILSNSAFRSPKRKVLIGRPSASETIVKILSSPSLSENAACIPSGEIAKKFFLWSNTNCSSPPLDEAVRWRLHQLQDYLELINQANAIFQKQFPGMGTYNAIGAPRSGTVAKTPNDLVTWIFWGTNKRVTAKLQYANGAFGQPETVTPPLGVAMIPLPQGTIRLPQAISILNGKGYTNGFVSVGMATPVVPQAQPMFWFCVDGNTQGVSASTGEFFPDLFPCYPIDSSD